MISLIFNRWRPDCILTQCSATSFGHTNRDAIHAVITDSQHVCAHTIFIGQRWRFNIPEHRYIKSVSAFYELSTCDLYLVSAVQNSYMKPADYLRLSFGVKLQIL